jgi:hypothetical protein
LQEYFATEENWWGENELQLVVQWAVARKKISACGGECMGGGEGGGNCLGAISMTI